MKFKPVRIAEETVIAESHFGKNTETFMTIDEELSKFATVADAANALPIEIYELLDRFEILYPNLDDIADLRRAYVDKDLSSIFRLLPKKVNGDIDDLRKAVLEQNLHSIFRLSDDEDLRKLILEDNAWKLWPVLSSIINTQFIAAFKSFFVNKTEFDKDCFSRGQLKSKLWLVDELKKLKINDLGTVFLCAGWYATLATMLFEKGFKINKIRSFDIDPACVDIAETFNKKWVKTDWQFKSCVENIYHINYKTHTYNVRRSDGSECELTDIPDTIINTSCEHLEDFYSWFKRIPDGKLVILQANDYHEVEEHVNTYNTLDEFVASAPMANVLYKGELELDKYTRFMLIGYR